MTKVTVLLLLTLLFSIIVYVVTNITVSDTVFVSARIWCYGSQLFHHYFFFASYHFVHFFSFTLWLDVSR